MSGLPRWPLVDLGFCLAICCVVLQGYCGAMSHRETYQAQQRMRKTWIAVCTTSLLWDCVYLTLIGLKCHSVVFAAWGWFPPKAVALFLHVHPELLLRVRVKLRSRAAQHAQTQASIYLAGLVGQFSMESARRTASGRFRGVQLCERVDFGLAERTPCPTLAIKRVSCKLKASACDAYISHSTCDCNVAKWDALREWRSRFLWSVGREPILWYNQYCADLPDFDTDLMCLPLFMLGCRRLVVCCGPTYLTRLLCLLELTVFLRIGRHVSDIDFLPVQRKGDEVVDSARIGEAFDLFDITNCSDLPPSRRCKILSIIQAAFVDVGFFNAEIHAVFEAAGWRLALHGSRQDSSIEMPCMAVTKDSSDLEFRAGAASPLLQRASAGFGEASPCQLYVADDAGDSLVAAADEPCVVDDAGGSLVAAADDAKIVNHTSTGSTCQLEPSTGPTSCTEPPSG